MQSAFAGFRSQKALAVYGWYRSSKVQASEWQADEFITSVQHLQYDFVPQASYFSLRPLHLIILFPALHCSQVELYPSLTPIISKSVVTSSCILCFLL